MAARRLNRQGALGREVIATNRQRISVAGREEEWIELGGG